MWIELSIYFAGLLYDSGIFIARMAINGSNLHNISIYSYIYNIGHFGIGTDTMAAKNRATIWVVDDENIFHSVNSRK